MDAMDFVNFPGLSDLLVCAGSEPVDAPDENSHEPSIPKILFVPSGSRSRPCFTTSVTHPRGVPPFSKHSASREFSSPSALQKRMDLPRFLQTIQFPITTSAGLREPNVKCQPPPVLVP